MNTALLDAPLHTPGLDSTVRELRATKPRLRRGLRFTFQEYTGGRYALIEDALHSKFHRVGLPEYLFLTYLDGRRTLSEAFARASLAAGPEAITESEALSLTQWLVDNHLVDFDATSNEIAAEHQDKQHQKRAMELVNFMFLKMPVGSPDAFFTGLHRVAGWLCHPIIWLLWVVVVVVAIGLVIYDWRRFSDMAGGIFSATDAVVMLIIWAGLKVVHELGHGMVCKYYGCRVREAGVTLILFMPITYVDATSSWALPSKWQRMHVSFGGLWVELFIASAAAIYWSYSAEGYWNTIAYKLMIIAGSTTLLFNINPLMRFDGYYLLSDYLGMPNLYQRAQLSLMRFCNRYLVGKEVQEQTGVPLWERATLFSYGVASLVWRVVTMGVLIIAASTMWKGGGLILGIFCGVLWVVPGLYSFINTLATGEGVGAASRMRLIFRLALFAAVVAVVCYIPIYPTVTSPAVVQVKDMVVLRAECPGFINRVLVKEGDSVKQGQLLVEVRNLEETKDVEVLALKLKYQEAKTSMAMGEKETQTGELDLPSFQAEQASLDGMRKQYAEKAKRLASLNIIAPSDGTVLVWKLPQRVGTFLQPGDEVLRMGVLPANELKLSIPEHAVDAFRAHIGERIEVLLPGRVETEAILDRVTSRGNRDVVYPEITTLAGGPLSVARRKQDSSHQKDDKNPYSGYELVAPTFEAVAHFAGTPPTDIRSGEVARTRFRTGAPIPLWKQAYAWTEGAVKWLFHRAKHEADQS